MKNKSLLDDLDLQNIRIHLLGKYVKMHPYIQVTSKPSRRHNNNQTDDYKHKMKR
ncbi:MAG: hypothetical protein NTU43_08360 [Bacteroidetes bacterium]|nr:hypothetical protein [Bacteroidota bacterium]